MKRMIMLFLLLIGNKISIAQTWEAQTSGTSFDLRAVHFVNSTVGTAVGYSGAILRTTDGGISWTTQTSGTLTDFLGVHFVDANTGWVVGGVGTILNTTNAGVTWSPQTSGISTTIEDVFFTDANNGYAAGRYGKFLSTTDGGANWSVGTFDGTNDWFQAISFYDANHGFATGFYGRVLRIENGIAALARTTYSNPIMYGAAAVSADTAYICGASGAIQKTTNGGSTWSSQTSGIANTLFEIMFIDANNGIAVGSSGKIVATTDGGANWSPQTSGTAVQLWGVWCINGGTAVVVGNGGTILRSTNVSLPVELASFSALTNQNGIELNWKTATEVNNYGFEIERSPSPTPSQREGTSQVPPLGGFRGAWGAIGFVEGKGTTNKSNEYSFFDSKLSAGKYSYRLKQIDNDGKFEYSQEVEVTIVKAPQMFALMQNYPNPFNPTTNISFTLQSSGFTSLKVHDMLGKEVTTLVSEVKEAGSYAVQFDASKLSSGIYFYTLKSRNNIQTKKLLLLK